MLFFNGAGASASDDDVDDCMMEISRMICEDGMGIS